MDWVYFSIGIALIIVGFLGSILPVLPGPPIAYVGILLQQLREEPPFSTFWLVAWGAIVLIITILDYWFPVYGTKVFGGSKYGAWGSMIGLIIGMLFLGPFGVIIGPFLGAYIGEIIKGYPQGKALKAAFGSFLGFLAGTFVKIITIIGLLVYLIISVFSIF